MAGAIFYMYDDVVQIINGIAAKLLLHEASEMESLEVASCGTFSLRKVDISWTKTLMRGALDFYQEIGIQALQVVPDAAHWTIDVPDLSQPWSATREPAWRWLYEEWPYPVPLKSVGITNLGALRGKKVTEVMRWEEDEWELFAGAGPDIPKSEMRVVPLGVLLAADESLAPVVNLPVGSGLWRDADSEWHPWGRTSVH